MVTSGVLQVCRNLWRHSHVYLCYSWRNCI